MADLQFFVVLGPDGAGKSSVMAETSARLPGWRMVSTDEAFLGAEHGLITELRRNLVKQVLPAPRLAERIVTAAGRDPAEVVSDDELGRALTELRRVVRPGGIVAVKDLDASLITVRPAEPFLFTDFFRRAAEKPSYAGQFLRTRDLYRWLRRAGLRSVTQRTMLIEHFAPLPPAARWFYGLACSRVAEQAMTMGLPGEWGPFLEPDDPANPLRDPSGYISEGNTVATGIVPPAADTASPAREAEPPTEP